MKLLKLDLSEDLISNKLDSIELALKTSTDMKHLERMISICCDQLYFTEVEFHELGQAADRLQEALFWVKLFNESIKP